MTFQIHALPADNFKPLFTLSNAELAEIHATKKIVDTKVGYPCRVSLADAEIGETVILVNFVHQPGDSPYRASHAIYVRENAEQAFPEVGTVPDVLTSRLISIRAFDDRHYIISADVVNGSSLVEAIPAMFDDPNIAYLHLHNAKEGCYHARVARG